MREAIESYLSEHDRVGERSQLLAVVSRDELDDEIRRGHLVRLYPRVYARPWDADELTARWRAALLSIGPPSALSHVTALRAWGLPVPASWADSIHVTVPNSRRISASVDVVLHRTRRQLPVTALSGLPVLSREAAICSSWPQLTGADQRAPAIVAVRSRATSPQRLHAEATAAVRLPHRSRLLGLTRLLQMGCESELELWGYTQVFDIAGLRHSVRQRTLRVGGHTYRLDLAYERERLAVELDGRAYHASPSQWERDIRRDLALATAGWQTIRLSHARLTTDVGGCRRDVLAVLAARQLRSDSG
jgi:very-short-patch-repair endonuclease